MELGDKKPSQLLREMRSLAGTQVNDDFLKTLFLQRLPINVRSILATSKDELDNLAAMADKIIEFSANPQYINAQTNKVEGIATTENDRLSRLEKHIEQLTATIQELKFRSNSRSRSRTPGPNNNKICWYHRKFRDQAKKCLQPCSYKPANNPQQENS